MSPRLRVVAGRPTDAELAAVVTAVDLDAASPAPADTPSGWLRAARLEGVGAPAVAAPHELGRPEGRGAQPPTSRRPSMPASRWPGMEQ